MGKGVKKLALALQGGGAHGAFTWGVLDRLLETDEVCADAMCGTSAGAINAVVCAYGLHKGGPDLAKTLLNDLWKRISLSSSIFFKPTGWDQLMGGEDIYNSPGFMWFNAMTQYFSPYDFNPLNFNPLKYILNDIVDFNELKHYNKKRLFICATNVKTNRSKIFTNENLTVDALLASSCLPYLFQAVEIDGEYYWDGGYLGNPPIFPIINETKLKDILLIKINSINIDKVPTTAREISDRVNEISFNSSLIHEMQMIHYRNELIKSGVLKKDNGINREIFIHTISGYKDLGNLNQSSKMNTSYDFLLSLKNKGREAAEQWLMSDFKDVGKHSTFDVEKHFFIKY
jgi:NTE family protein